MSKSPNRSCQFWSSNRKIRSHRFWVQTGRNRRPSFEAKPRNSRSSSPCPRCRPHTSSPDLSIVWSLSTRPVLDHLGPLHQASYSCHDPCRYPPCRTCHLHTTRQANTILHTNMIIGYNHQNFPDSNWNQGKSITHHNQNKLLITWFLNLSPWWVHW
jgi:hypothetical protein